MNIGALNRRHTVGDSGESRQLRRSQKLKGRIMKQKGKHRILEGGCGEA